MSKNVERKYLTYAEKVHIILQKEVKGIKKQKISVQEWLPFEKILENGIIKVNKTTYVKIIKVKPINFNLKSELEKEAILNSYKIFLKSCDFNFQILIQSKKEDLNRHIEEIKLHMSDEEENIKEISEKYINYIKSLNHDKKSSSKNFYIVLKYKSDNEKDNNIENYAIEELNERYFKIKDCLSRCGNIVTTYNNYNNTLEILFSFFNTRVNLNLI
jgi:conjugal transfer ATP-binding protein TraC